jgi:hypothetical protein
MQEMSTAAQTQSPNSLEGMPNEILQLILYYAIRDDQHVWSSGTHLRTFHAIAELGTHIEEVLLNSAYQLKADQNIEGPNRFYLQAPEAANEELCNKAET